MDLTAARQLALDLMAEHLAEQVDGDPARYFRWSNAVKQAGSASFAAKRIRRAGRWVTDPSSVTWHNLSLSRKLVALWPEDEVRDVILHEIAHVLVGPQHGHDVVWKAACRRVGAKPERTYEGTLPSIDLPWVATCPSCGHVAQRTRPLKPGAHQSCRSCSGRRYDPAYELVYVRRGAASPRPTPSPVVQLEAAHEAASEPTRRVPQSTQEPLF